MNLNFKLTLQVFSKYNTGVITIVKLKPRAYKNTTGSTVMNEKTLRTLDIDRVLKPLP